MGCSIKTMLTVDDHRGPAEGLEGCDQFDHVVRLEFVRFLEVVGVVGCLRDLAKRLENVVVANVRKVPA